MTDKLKLRDWWDGRLCWRYCRAALACHVVAIPYGFVSARQEVDGMAYVGWVFMAMLAWMAGWYVGWRD